MGDGVLGLVGATAMTVGLLLLAIKLLHKLDRRGVGHGRVPMQILQRLPLGAKQGLVVVRSVSKDAGAPPAPPCPAKSFSEAMPGSDS